jgi:DNA replication protein DnaC
MLRTHQLAPKLKALRLGGMLDTLELRLQQAQQGQGGYLEFLESLLEDEITRRDNKALSLRLQRARFEAMHTLAEFDFSYNPKIPAPQIRDLARGGYITANQSVIICGPVGVGKSHIAQGLGHAACQQGHTVLYSKTNRLLTDLGGGHADGTAEARLRRYLQPDLLILDDFGMRGFNEQQTEDLWELIGERRYSVIVVSNRAPQDWYPLFPNPVLAESVLDRLINSAHHLVLTGRSYRPLRRPDRNRPPDSVPPDGSADDTAEAAGA